MDNPGRYDAVNSYGDEDVTTNNNYLRSYQERRDRPGLGIFLRNGYNERSGGLQHLQREDRFEPPLQDH
ncbi:MAG: hypothetical protein IPI07_16335 [Flavobacteriales bacterium]|nr:hypothetical protein [Flavobacteriales bacterium]